MTLQYEVVEVPVEDIFFDRDFNCRSFTIDSTASLAKSIEKHGLFAPIILHPYKGRYRITAGHRRYIAMRYHLRRATIPAFIRESETEANLAENLDRKELNIFEQALAIRKSFPGASLRKIAKALNRSAFWVELRVRLLNLPKEIQKMAARGELNTRQVENILRKKGDVEYARKLADSSRRMRKTPGLREIREMMRSLSSRGCDEEALRFGLWVVGDISTEEFNKFLKKDLDS